MTNRTTVADVEDLLDRTLPNTARVARLITRAEGIVAADMPGLTFGTGTEQVSLEGDGDDYLVLPRYPVNAVNSVTIAGTALTAPEYSFDNLGRVRRLYSARWPDAGTIVVVSYDYGFGATSVDPAVASVVAELVAARVNNPEHVTQESIGDRSHAFAETSGAGDDLTAGQRHRLRHWRRNRFASARVRL